MLACINIILITMLHAVRGTKLDTKGQVAAGIALAVHCTKAWRVGSAQFHPDEGQGMRRNNDWNFQLKTTSAIISEPHRSPSRSR